MSTHPYYGPGNIVIDSCEGCDAVWLDFGELTQITDAPGRDRGNRNAPAVAHSFTNMLDDADVQTLTGAEDPLTTLFRLLA